MMLSSPVPALDRGADGLDGDEDEVAVLWVRVLVSDLFLLDMLPRRDAVQFVKVGVWIRTGEQVYVLINLDIHKFWRNVIMPYSKNFIGGKSFVKFYFPDNFEGIKTNGCQEYEFIVFTVWEVSKSPFDTRGVLPLYTLHGDL